MSRLFFYCVVSVCVLHIFLKVPWIGLQSVIVVFPDHLTCFSLKSSLLFAGRLCIDKLGDFHANQISMCLVPHRLAPLNQFKPSSKIFY